MSAINPSNTESRTRIVFVLLCLIGLAVTFSFERIEQDVRYHDFADARPWLGVPNVHNVVSNLPFLWVGGIGLFFLYRRGREIQWLAPFESTMFSLLFLGGLLTGLGSSFYHAWPNNETLVWDRLPLTLVFTCFFSAVVTDRLGPQSGKACYLPLAAIGALSVIYWHWTESIGAGDLRPYYFVQFFPMLAIPLMVVLLRPRYSQGADLLWILVWYSAAKLSEILDARIFELTGFVSGHTVKHLLAGVALWWVLRWLKRRKPLSTEAVAAA